MKTKMLMLLLFFVFALSGCDSGGSSSGGGNGQTPNSADARVNPVGIWNGTTADNRSLKAVVLPSGDLFAAYTMPGSSNFTNYFEGAFISKGSSKNGNYTSSKAADFNFYEGILKGVVNAAFTPESIMNASFRYSDGTKSFVSLSYDNHSLKESIPANLYGSYVGKLYSNNGSEDAGIRFNPDGTIYAKGLTTGCVFTGTATAEPNGDIFRVSLKFENSVCFSSDLVFNGVAAVGANKDLMMIAPDTGFASGLFFYGKKTAQN